MCSYVNSLFHMQLFTKIQAQLWFKDYSTINTKSTSTTRQPTHKQKICALQDN